MRNLKVTVIGAGSTYTPELIEGFILRKDCIKLDSLYLMDIDLGKTNIVAGLIKRMFEKKQLNPKIVITDNLDEAIEGAHYVLGQVRVGKLDARITDEKIPLKYNILGQETTGAGGFMKALRTIPVIMNVARKIEKLAPEAWLINFSNPSGIIAEAVLNNSNVNMMGLCNVPINLINGLKKAAPEGTKEIDYDFVGLNHLCWITALYADGKSIPLKDLEKVIESSAMKNVPKAEYDSILLETVKGIPASYLNYYYFRDEQVKKCLEAEKTRGEICKEIEIELLNLYKDTNLNEKPKVLESRGGALYSEAAISLIDAIENDKNELHVVDVKNKGAFDFMDYNDVVEVKCIVNKDGATPISLHNFDDQYIIGMMRVVKAYEKLAVKAGIHGDYNAALAALMVHPLIGDYKKSKAVLNEMLATNKRYLPQFNIV